MPVASFFGSAKFLLVDGVPLKLSYTRLPDTDTRADDIVLEAASGNVEISLTREELEQAVEVAPGILELKTGETLEFITPATIH